MWKQVMTEESLIWKEVLPIGKSHKSRGLKAMPLSWVAQRVDSVGPEACVGEHSGSTGTYCFSDCLFFKANQKEKV